MTALCSFLHFFGFTCSCTLESESVNMMSIYTNGLRWVNSICTRLLLLFVNLKWEKKVKGLYSSSRETYLRVRGVTCYYGPSLPLAVVRIWNSLPQHATSAPSLLVFRSRIKTHFLTISHPSWWPCTVLAQWEFLCHFTHFNRSCYLLTYTGSHSLTSHPTQENAIRLNPSHRGWYSIYLPRRDGRLS